MQSFISNLTFPRKFALIGLLALLLLAVPTTLLFRSLAGRLADAERERQAIAPAAAVLKLVQVTQQHRGLTAGFLAGQASAVAPRQAKQADVDAAWAQVRQALLAFGDVRLQKDASGMAEAWAALAQAVSTQALQAPQSFARHTVLVTQQLALLQALAVESGIARHHQLSGYHVQLAVLGQLPRLSETMGQLRARANAVLVRGSIAAEDRLRLEGLLAQARQISAELKGDLTDLQRVAPAESQRVGAATAAVFSAAEQVLSLAETDIVKADTLSLQAPLFWARITQAIDQQFDLSKVLFVVLDEQIAVTYEDAVRQMAVVGATVLALAALGAWLLLAVARGVQRSVRQAVDLTQAVAAGDLSTPMPPTTGDEMGQLLQALARMQQGLSVVVGSVRRNAESVATASAQIAQGNLDLSSRTEGQASALQQTAATMDELGSTVRNNADNSRQADELALGAANIAIKGGEMVNQVVQTMRGINESSRQIAEIISVIDSIAFQTNILALNAAVEAARAGEQGRGFAVVASEVRTLAQRSAGAARQIKDLITTSVQRVEQGTTLVDEAGQTMQGIVAAIDRVKSVVAEISSASVEQSLGVTQIGQAVTQMDQATQRNAALVEQSAAAAESLREQAQALVSVVSAFRLAV